MVTCKRCGRTLKSLKSIERGYGPSCWKKVKKPMKIGGRKYIQTRLL